MVTSNWDKFRLLLWKNWILQWNHKFQLIVELFIPVIFSLLLVLVRTLVDPQPEQIKYYDPVNISNLELMSGKIKNLTVPMKTLNYTLAYSPQNSCLEKVIADAAASLKSDHVNVTYSAHANALALETYLRTSNILAGVEFDDSFAGSDECPKNFDYALRFPSELRTTGSQLGLTWFTNNLFPLYTVGGPRNKDSEDGGIPPGYIQEGFVPIQNAISSAFIKLTALKLNASSEIDTNFPQIVMQRYPYPAYLWDPLLMGLESMVSLIILLSFIYPCTYTIKCITGEKEKQLKEVMKIMGLNNWLHWAAWFVKSFLMMGFSAICIVIMMKIRWTNDVAVLNYSSWTALIFFLLIYVIATITFCFMLSTFFSRASTAAAVSGLIWFIAYVPFSFTQATYGGLSLTTKLGLGTILNTAMGYGFKLILQFEATGEGLQWSNLFKPVSVDDTLTIGYLVIMMLVGSVIMMIICLYIEQISPGDFGVPKKWNFPFTAQFWCGQPEYNGIEDLSNNSCDDERNNDGFEPEPTGKRVGLQVKNLRKVFGKKVAVNGVSMNMYEDEITVLLGHNGAGKTTTISMLTGMFPPTGGTAIINGSDIRTNIAGARMSLGVCPQHNILFDDLSVRDHIIFYSRLKGLKGKDVEAEIQKYIKILQLENKEFVASSKLSGGMKRKLSVGVALCGGTKVVLCDEPSSGMDPAARRQLWDLLQSEKAGRTILLTTHFMDEADVLGDRIAIMCDGDLKCYGTSFFLKKKFGSGYRLICVKKNNCESNMITALLRKYIPDIEVEAEIGAELSYQLPDKYSSIFEEMLSDLEYKSDELQLNGYGVSITSLEEVFMKVGAEINAKQDEDASGPIANGNGVNGNGNYLDNNISLMSSENTLAENTRLLEGTNLMSNQWKAMFLKKMIYTYRNWLMLLIQFVIPTLFAVMTIMIIRTQATFRVLLPRHITLTDYDSAVTLLEVGKNVTGGSIESSISEQYEKILKSYPPQYEFRTVPKNFDFEEYILELSKTILVRINGRYLAAASITKGYIVAWLNNQPLHTAPLTLNFVHNAMARAYLDESYSIGVTNKPLPFTTETQFKQLETGNNLGTQLATNLCFSMSFVSALYILFLIKERASRAKLLQFVSGVNVWTYWLTQFIWDMMTYIVTALILMAAVACFQEDGFSTFSELGKVFTIFIFFGLAAIPFTYLFSYRFDEPAIGFGRISLLNLFAGMALFIVIIVMSAPIFDTKPVADVLQWIFMIYPHFSLAQGLNKLSTNIATRNICDKACGLIPFCTDELMCMMEKKCCYVPYFGWKSPGILPEVVYMIGGCVGFFLLLIVIEYRFIDEVIFKIKKRTMKPPPPPEDGYYDEDVNNERNRIQTMTVADIQSQNLVLDGVTKFYGKFLAVNQVSVGVMHSECFGLLGVNGAGKTTTFKMLTGDERISTGDAYVKGFDLKSAMNEVYKEIGYCPQFDALLDDLTGREMLRIFCLLRGIADSHIPQVSQDLAQALGFVKHLDKPTKTYSGGNKRKLSTAIALIGGPSVVYLDEPTTGMDPAARRQLWNVICRIRDSGKSIVLTSHSMEECEALCTRLAIMVNGEFKCIGSTQHLKNKFSKGLVLKMKMKKDNEFSRSFAPRKTSINEEQIPMQRMLEDIEQVKTFVSKEFPEAILQEQYQGILTFYIPLSSIRWSKIFGLMEKNRNELNIEDYSISQTTLEQIFLEFAKYQREDPREINKSRGGLFRCCRRR